MSKLLKLKEWLTLENAASHISNVLGEPVSIADLYRFCLDGHLKISANFVNHANARKGKYVKTKDVKFEKIEHDFFTNEKLDIPFSMPTNHELHVSGDDWISLERKVVSISGVWELTMLGSEMLDIEHNYQQATSGLEVTLVSLEGVFMEQGDVIAHLQTDYDDNEYQSGSKAAKGRLDRHIFNNKFSKEKVLELQEKYEKDRKEFIDGRKDKPKENNYFPSGGLDEHDYALVVRTTEITRFIQSLEDTAQDEKPLASKERNSLLVLIAALCKEANVNPKQRGIASSLVAMTELIGAPLTDDTIRKILNQIEPAIETRSK